MHLKHGRIILLVLSCLMLATAGCESDREVDPVVPGEMTFLLITITPSPVYESSDGEFHFYVIVEEEHDVGATINQIKIESISEDGEILDKDYHDETWISEHFGTSYIEPLGRLVASVELEAAYSSHLENWVFRGTDDHGNSFEYSQSVELIYR